MMYAACDLNEPHVIRAFINNDGKAPLPSGYHCVEVNEKEVDAEILVIGTTPTGEVPEVKMSIEDRLQALELKVDSVEVLDVPARL